MATAKLLTENEGTELKEMNQSVILPKAARARKGDASKIYECVCSEGETNLDNLRKIIYSGKSDVNYIENGRTALHEAVRKDEVETVKLLMSAGASIEFKDVDGNTALHYAYLKTCPEENAAKIFKLLFPQGKNLETIRISKTRKRSNIQKCRCHTRTFEHTWLDAATSTNNDGDNILNLILQVNPNECLWSIREIVQYLIKETEMFYLLKLLRNTQRPLHNSTSEVGSPFESNDNNSITSPFRRLLELYPEFVSDLLDRCIVKTTGKVNYHFELLDDTYLLHTWPPQQEYYCKWLYQCQWEYVDAEERKRRDAYTEHPSEIRNNHPVMLMLKHKRDKTSKDPGKKEVYRQLVDHPLVKALIKHKWQHIGRKFHIMSLIIYLIFLLTLTAFVNDIDKLYVRFQDSDTISSTSNKTGYNTSSYNETTSSTTHNHVTCETYGNYPMITVLQIVVIFLAIILILKEVFKQLSYSYS
ncbi:transient receptor potential cation channel subfamily A member 1 homolog [Ruditapes philippinarum]|uniref:transient receptor potential cation channel subfamily A member 1 homolog n=1 Tax=Ruditapes philippinarum TaxID=129788 RepID=UPI00295B1377|nr:transient receptor potential cation channel subfamily A member 1 homolog [Ruditapes philippinarum]